ncbi:hypothetical protein [Blastococcus litoris]|uniref:hypothetical protein n=1 Tax=Blastococcus litoris TaxID=2171622 RepID=UPI0013DF9473|nr:hypothetical protein [Blastococcus litoris]
MEQWYRTRDWDAAARADFEQRLGRSRGSRSQYLKIKAAALEDAGLLDEAVGLYERFLREHPGDFFVRYVHECLGGVARKRGRLDEAERRYRLVLTFRPLNGTMGMTEVSLAEVLLDRGRADDAAATLAGADQSSVSAFYANRFRYLTASARIASARGENRTAADLARQALALMDAPDQYSRHPGVGAVQSDDATTSLLAVIASADSPPAG